MTQSWEAIWELHEHGTNILLASYWFYTGIVRIGKLLSTNNTELALATTEIGGCIGDTMRLYSGASGKLLLLTEAAAVEELGETAKLKRPVRARAWLPRSELARDPKPPGWRGR